MQPPKPNPSDDDRRVHFGRLYVTVGAQLTVTLCGAQSPTTPGSVGVIYSSSWQLVDCADCLGRRHASVT